MGNEQYILNVLVYALGGFLSITRSITTGGLRITGKGATMRPFPIIPGPWN